jgi:hypothetical protein
MTRAVVFFARGLRSAAVELRLETISALCASSFAASRALASLIKKETLAENVGSGVLNATVATGSRRPTARAIAGQK